eukprot:17672-Chlamydomonas_euryale.AAC.1
MDKICGRRWCGRCRCQRLRQRSGKRRARLVRRRSGAVARRARRLQLQRSAAAPTAQQQLHQSALLTLWHTCMHRGAHLHAGACRACSVWGEGCGQSGTMRGVWTVANTGWLVGWASNRGAHLRRAARPKLRSSMDASANPAAAAPPGAARKVLRDERRARAHERRPGVVAPLDAHGPQPARAAAAVPSAIHAVDACVGVADCLGVQALVAAATRATASVGGADALAGVHQERTRPVAAAIAF